MSGTLVCFVSLGQSQPYAKCPYVWYTCVLSLLDRAGPFAKCPYVWYTGLLCLSWTEPAVMPSVLMSGTLVMSLLDRARPLCQMEEEEESGEAQKEGTRRRRTEKVKQFWFLWAMVV